MDIFTDIYDKSQHLDIVPNIWRNGKVACIFKRVKKRTLGTTGNLRDRLNHGTDLPGRYLKHREDREVTKESLLGFTTGK